MQSAAAKCTIGCRRCWYANQLLIFVSVSPIVQRGYGARDDDVGIVVIVVVLRSGLVCHRNEQMGISNVGP